MAEKMNIGKKDVVWYYTATFMRVASGIILLPLTLNMLSGEEIGLWSIFLQLGGLAILLDFGFQNSFGRNITYIFSGVKQLQAEGNPIVDETNKSIDYTLLKSVIRAMKRYYGIAAGVFTVIFLGISPFYFTKVLSGYTGDKTSIWIAWIIYGLLVAYELYTYYYTSLLLGRGRVKRVQQIIVIAQASRIVISALFLFLDYGVIALVIGQLVCDVVNRAMCYRAFYDNDLRMKLKQSLSLGVSQIMKIMTPNAVKIGVTTLGTFLTGKIVILIAPLLGITLPIVGSYGITKQMIDLTISLSMIWFATFYPKFTRNIVHRNLSDLKRMYVKSKLFMFATFLICGLGLWYIVPLFFRLIESNTELLPGSMILVMLIFALFESNFNIATGFLLAENKVPFMKSSLITGVASSALLLLLLKFTSLQAWAMIIAPGVAMSAYQYWKWAFEVLRGLQLTPKTYWTIAGNTLRTMTIKKT